MPKDWLRYKADIHRLYIVEDKTVDQIREHFTKRCHFIASVRAYRMKFDEWDMRKYNCQKARTGSRSLNRTRLSAPSSGCLEAAHSSPHLVDAKMAPMQSSSTPMEIVDDEPPTIEKVLGSIDVNTASALEIIETILQNWQPDPSFTAKLKHYFEQPDFDKWVSRYDDQPEVFNLIERYVEGRENQFSLIKNLLEADLSCRKVSGDPDTPWQKSWYEAIFYSPDWERSKGILDDEDHLLRGGSRVFVDCAEVVIAERFLEKYTQLLTLSSNHPLDPSQVAEKEKYIAKYRDILRSFHHAKEDVCPRFYRYLLRFDLEDQRGEMRSERGYEDEYRQKYILLASLRPQRLCSFHHDQDEESMDMSWFFGDTNQSTKNNLPPTPPTPTDSKPRSFTITTSKAVEILIQRWHDLSGFEEYTHNLFSRDGSHLSIFTSSDDTYSENMFDAIRTTVISPTEQISLAKALLLTSTTYSPHLISYNQYTQPWLLAWWQNIYPCSPSISDPINYDRYCKDLLTNPALDQELAKVVKTEKGRKLFMDAAIHLVGERLLGVMKCNFVQTRFDDRRYVKIQNKYFGVIGLMESRGIVVDPSWRAYATG